MAWGCKVEEPKKPRARDLRGERLTKKYLTCLDTGLPGWQAGGRLVSPIEMVAMIGAALQELIQEMIITIPTSTTSSPPKPGGSSPTPTLSGLLAKSVDL